MLLILAFLLVALVDAQFSKGTLPLNDLTQIKATLGEIALACEVLSGCHSCATRADCRFCVGDGSCATLSTPCATTTTTTTASSISRFTKPELTDALTIDPKLFLTTTTTTTTAAPTFVFSGVTKVFPTLATTTAPTFDTVIIKTSSKVFTGKTFAKRSDASCGAGNTACCPSTTSTTTSSSTSSSTTSSTTTLTLPADALTTNNGKTSSSSSSSSSLSSTTNTAAPSAKSNNNDGGKALDNNGNIAGGQSLNAIAAGADADADDSLGLIIGGCVGGLMCLIGIALLVVVIARRKKPAATAAKSQTLPQFSVYAAPPPVVSEPSDQVYKSYNGTQFV